MLAKQLELMDEKFNGLILKTIDEIPIANLCFTNESYRFEILKIKNNSITSVKIQKI